MATRQPRGPDPRSNPPVGVNPGSFPPATGNDFGALPPQQFPIPPTGTAHDLGALPPQVPVAPSAVPVPAVPVSVTPITPPRPVALTPPAPINRQQPAAPVPQPPSTPRTAPPAKAPVSNQSVPASVPKPSPMGSQPASWVAAQSTKASTAVTNAASTLPVVVTLNDAPSKPQQPATDGSGEEDAGDAPPQWQQLLEFAQRHVLRAAPPWLISMVVHMLSVIVLALVYFSEEVKESFVLAVTYAEDQGEQLLDDTSFTDAIDPVEIAPALALDRNPVDDPLAAPPKLDVQLDMFNAPTAMAAPTIGLALSGREKGAKRALLAAYGGNGETEEAVGTALEWLKRQQSRDGSWRLDGPYENGVLGAENRVAATAMALLAFQGNGNTHREGDYKDVVKRGMDALLKMQDREGSFFSNQRLMSNHQLYSQGQATIAICELYGMSKDEALRKPAQLALDYAGSIQADDGYGGGGWRYQPGQDADTSVTGWFVMALQSGKMANLNVSESVLNRVSAFLDNVAAPPGEGSQFVSGSRYLYRSGDKERVSMTAEALLCRQYLGWKHEDPRLVAGVEHLLKHPIDWDPPNLQDAPSVYYWYYATQVLHHMGGEPWEKWNRTMKTALPRAQVKTGPERGSWSPSGDQFGSTGGRLYMTCLCTYMLEVYYRHLPIYQHQ